MVDLILRSLYVVSHFQDQARVLYFSSINNIEESHLMLSSLHDSGWNKYISVIRYDASLRLSLFFPKRETSSRRGFSPNALNNSATHFFPIFFHSSRSWYPKTPGPTPQGTGCPYFSYAGLLRTSGRHWVFDKSWMGSMLEASGNMLSSKYIHSRGLCGVVACIWDKDAEMAGYTTSSRLYSQ